MAADDPRLLFPDPRGIHSLDVTGNPDPRSRGSGRARPGAALFSLFSTLGYISSGWGVAGAPAWSLGFVYLPATVVMGVAVAVFGPVGVRLARHFNDWLLRLILALFVLGAAVLLLL